MSEGSGEGEGVSDFRLENIVNKKLSAFLLATMLLAAVPLAEAQQPKVYRVGVITAGGAWYEVIDGLRARSQTVGA